MGRSDLETAKVRFALNLYEVSLLYAAKRFPPEACIIFGLSDGGSQLSPLFFSHLAAAQKMLLQRQLI